MNLVTEKLSPADVRISPFPHVILNNAIDEQLCRSLIEQLPQQTAFIDNQLPQSNERFNINAGQSPNNEYLSPDWKAFINLHVGQQFLDQIFTIFEQPMKQYYPHMFDLDNNPNSRRSGVRNIDTFDNANLLLDAQIGINTPVIGTSSTVRGPHLDSPDKLFTGLFYLRHPDDRSTGGELELYVSKSSDFGRNLSLDINDVQPRARIPYQPNTFVMFLNTPHSLHGVTPRSVTQYPRYFVNFVGVVSKPLYSVDRSAGSIVSRFRLSHWNPFR